MSKAKDIGQTLAAGIGFAAVSLGLKYAWDTSLEGKPLSESRLRAVKLIQTGVALGGGATLAYYGHTKSGAAFVASYLTVASLYKRDWNVSDVPAVVREAIAPSPVRSATTAPQPAPALPQPTPVRTATGPAPFCVTRVVASDRAAMQARVAPSGRGSVKVVSKSIINGALPDSAPSMASDRYVRTIYIRNLPPGSRLLIGGADATMRPAHDGRVGWYRAQNNESMWVFGVPMDTQQFTIRYPHGFEREIYLPEFNPENPIHIVNGVLQSYGT